MKIKEIDEKVFFYCEEYWELELLDGKIKELVKYRDDLILENVETFEDSQGVDINVVAFKHNDTANLLQLNICKIILAY